MIGAHYVVLADAEDGDSHGVFGGELVYYVTPDVSSADVKLARNIIVASKGRTLRLVRFVRAETVDRDFGT